MRSRTTGGRDERAVWPLRRGEWGDSPYAEHGDGAPLILIHGGLSSSSDWQPVVTELAASFRVITPDSRGHGRSTNPSGELSYALILGAAYPDFDAGGLREAHRALLGGDEAGAPDAAHLDAQLGHFADEIKALHPGGAEQWRELVRQTAQMWLGYEGLGPDELQKIETPERGPVLASLIRDFVRRHAQA